MINLKYNVKEFNTFIDIYFGSEKEYLGAIKKRYIVDNETEKSISGAAGATVPLECDGNWGWLVVIDDADYGERDIDKIIIHEITHVIIGIARHAGITMDKGSEEFYTYYLAHYIDKIRYDYIKKMRKSCTKLD